jgi:two-component system, NarL family, invasion response regulator UvrY
MDQIKIILADDHANVRQGLRRLLDRSPRVKVVGEAGDGIEALYLANHLKPDVLLLDVEMPGMKGVEVAKRLLESAPSVQVLALSGYTEKRYILGMFASGAAGYLTKDEAPKLLINAIQEIAAGRRGWISPKVLEKLDIPPPRVTSDARPALTNIEMRILRSIAAGMVDPEIEIEMHLESSVVADHIQSIVNKMEVNTRLEAVLRAIQEDLI